MKKRLSFLALALLAVLSASAQMIAYTVQTKVEGPAGTPTVIDLQGNTGVDFSGLMIDAEGNLEFNDVIDAKAFPIGFDFGYNSQVMKYFLIATNGMIQLSPTETVSSVVHKNNVTVFTDSGNHDAFGLIMRNGMFGYDDTQISYWLEGDDVLSVIPATAGTEKIEKALSVSDNVVLMKVYKNFPEVAELLEKNAMLDHAVMVSRCGLPDEERIDDIRARKNQPVNYLSTILARRSPEK